jgi:hypothetical protein
MIQPARSLPRMSGRPGRPRDQRDAHREIVPSYRHARATLALRTEACDHPRGMKRQTRGGAHSMRRWQ